MSMSQPLLVLEHSTQFDPRMIHGERPIIVRGGARNMAAFTRWTDDRLREAFRSISLVVRFPGGERARVPADTFIDYLAGSRSFVSVRGPMYLTDLYLNPSFGEEARAALSQEAPFPLPRKGRFAEWTSIYAGPAGTSSSIHQDIFSTHTWLALLRGQKCWRLAPPSVSEDAIGSAMTIDIVLNAGDIILLPPDWWHAVDNLTTTLAVSGNFCTFDHAMRARDQALASQSPDRIVWLRTWDEILRTQAVST